MASKQSYVSTVLWMPPDGDITSSRSTIDFRGSAAGDKSLSPMVSNSAIRTPTIAIPGPPLVSDRPDRSDPYRIRDIRVGTDEEQNKIREDELRQANREVQLRYSWNWTITAWNVVACLLCPICMYCMLGALLCNIFAYVDHKSRDYVHERKKVQCALWWSVAFFIVGVIAVVIVLVVLFVVLDVQDWTSVPTVPGVDFFM